MKIKTRLWTTFICFGMAFIALACGGGSASSPAQRKSTAGLTDAPATLASNLIYFKTDAVVPDEAMPMQMIAVDDANVYCWASPAKGKWTILKISKEGGEPVPLVTSDEYISAFTVDDEYLYWLTTSYSSEKSRLLKVEKKGGSPATLASYQGVSEHLLSDQSHLYYFLMSSPSEGALMKLKKQGGDPVTLTRVSKVFGVGLDDQRIYWTDTSGETLNWVEKGGGGRYAAPVSGVAQLFVDDKGIYIAADQRGLLQMDKNGAEVATLWPSVSSVFCQIASDDESVYFTALMRSGAGDEDDSVYNLFKLSKKDSSATPVLQDEAIFDLAVDGGRLYWANHVKKALFKSGKARPADADPNVAAGLIAFISIPAEGQVYLGGNKVAVTEITQRLKAAMKSKPPKQQVVYVRSAESVKYGGLAAVLSAAQKAEIKRVNLIVDRVDLGGYSSSPLLAVEVADHYSSLLEAPKEISTSGDSPKAEKGAKRRAPKSPAPPPPVDPMLIVTMKAGTGDVIELNTRAMSVSELEAFAKEELQYRLDKFIILQAAKSRPYGDVVKVIRALANADALTITLQLELLED